MGVDVFVTTKDFPQTTFRNNLRRNYEKLRDSGVDVDNDEIMKRWKQSIDKENWDEFLDMPMDDLDWTDYDNGKHLRGSYMGGPADAILFLFKWAKDKWLKGEKFIFDPVRYNIQLLLLEKMLREERRRPGYDEDLDSGFEKYFVDKMERDGFEMQPKDVMGITEQDLIEYRRFLIYCKKLISQDKEPIIQLMY